MTLNEKQEAAGRNLLLNCAGLNPGESLLILQESPDFGFYGDTVAKTVATVATRMGISATIERVPFFESVANLDPKISEWMNAADCTLFFARMGDQIRFRDLADQTRMIVSYALDDQMLSSGFGTAHYKGFVELKRAIDGLILKAAQIRVTCPLGTDFSGAMNCRSQPDAADVSIIRFPMSVFAPVPADGFRGKVVLSKFLTGTGSNYYHPYTVEFGDPVLVQFEDSRIIGFEGRAEDVAIANRHYDFVSGKFAIDRDFVHSWHVGIHPGCAYTRPASENYERWSGGAFGNPRLLHFHTCGSYPPGEISWNVVDPTVCIDGVAVWEDGRLYPDRIPGGRDLMDRYPCAAAVFADPSRDVGL